MKFNCIFIAVLALAVIPHHVFSAEPTKASQSSYEKNFSGATTSNNLTKADLAWHALNTYGWDCSEVVSKDKPTGDGSFVITCSNGKKFRVYPRQGKHPKITNMQGTYK